MMISFDRATSALATALRSGRGHQPTTRGARPTETLVLYEYEACPMCRRVREALTDLDLPVEVRPCPRGGDRFRPEAKATGASTFPFLVDPNTSVAMGESADIVAYLYERYGDGEPPAWLFGWQFVATSQLASMVRGTAGFRAVPTATTADDIRLTANETDADARRVREQLCAMEIAYTRQPGALRFEAGDVVLTDVDAILDHLGALAA